MTATHHITVNYYFTDEDMENIIVTALEGGIGYWACLDNSTVEPPEWGDWSKKPADMPTSVYAWQILKNHGTLHFLDEEDDGAEYFLELTNLYGGIARALKNGDWNGDMMDLDATAADAIIQYAVFGENIYG